MKRFSSRILWIAAKLFALLTALLGCSSKTNPQKPREIHWRGEETGYDGVTVAPPGHDADGGGANQPNP